MGVGMSETGAQLIRNAEASHEGPISPSGK